MKWRHPTPVYDRETGRRSGAKYDNCVETDEGYTIACIAMGQGKFCFTLAWRKQGQRQSERLKVIRDLPDRRDEKQKAFTEMKAFAEAHNDEQIKRSPSPP